MKKYHASLTVIAIFLQAVPTYASETVFSQNGRTYTELANANETIKTIVDDTALSPNRKISYTYDSQSRLVQFDGPRDDVNDIFLLTNVKKNTRVVTNPLGHVSQFTYDHNSKLIRSEDPNGIVTKFTYSNNFLSQVIWAAGTNASKTVEISRNFEGQISGLSTSDGVHISQVRKDDGAFTSLAQSLIDKIDEALAKDDFVELFSDRIGHSGRYFPESISPEKTSQQIFDERGRIISGVDEQGGLTSYSYDENDNISQVVDSRGVVSSFSYDGFGNVISEIMPDSGETTYKYDSAGNILERRYSNGVKHKFKYDALNRPIKETFKKGNELKVILYRYDECENGIGRVCAVRSDDMITRYTYNEYGDYKSVKVKHLDTSENETTRYAYGQGGRLKAIRYPTGLTVKYNYTAQGLPLNVKAKFEDGKNKQTLNILNSINIDTDTKNVMGFSFGNGLSSSMHYSDEGNLLSQSLVKDRKTIDSSNYSYDNRGNITKIQRLDANLNQSFNYDYLDRLTSEQRGFGEGSNFVKYDYDSVGNRTRRESSNRVRKSTYDSNSNRMIKSGRKDYTYDDRGNMLFDGQEGRSYGYDIRNRMNAFYKNDRLQATYKYNDTGQRIRKTLIRPAVEGDNYVTLNSTYTPEGWLLSEAGLRSKNEKSFVREYIWFNNRPVAQLERKIKANGKVDRVKLSYIHTDHLKTPRSATNENGETVWSWESNAFGDAKADPDVDKDGRKVSIRLRFPGQYFDRESGLFYNNYRDYNPKLGRYMQADPIGLFGGINRYAYVLNNPLKYIDPLGLDACGPSANECVVTGTRRRKVRPVFEKVSLGAPTFVMPQISLTFGGGGGGLPPIITQCMAPAGTSAAPGNTGPVNTWPTPGNSNLTPRDTSRGQGDGQFGTTRTGGRTHRGIDIAAPVGASVVAAGAGNAIPVDHLSGGTTVSIYHSGGYVTRYYHLDTRTISPTGGNNTVRVTAGQQIGTVGRTGNLPPTADSHLHFETIKNNVPVDPNTVLTAPNCP